MNTDKNVFNQSIKILVLCFYHLTNKLRGNIKIEPLTTPLPPTQKKKKREVESRFTISLFDFYQSKFLVVYSERAMQSPSSCKNFFVFE
jgi:hypothetical protein